MIFDIGPGVLPDLPPHRRIIWELPDHRLVESLEALAILNKRVVSIDMADER